MDANSRLVIQTDPAQAVQVVIPSPRRVAKIIKEKGACSFSDIKGPHLALTHEDADKCCECTADDLPVDRTFREAWDLDSDSSDSSFAGKRVKLNKARGVECAKQKIREKRDPKLADLDVRYMQEDEKGNSVKKAEIAAKKQTARDATGDSRLTDATNEVELKAAMDTIIGEVEAL